MRFFLKSHLFLSLCAACFTAQTYWIYSEQNVSLIPILINFIATFCVYNFQKLYAATINENATLEKYNWYRNNRKLLFTVIFLIIMLSFKTIYSFLIDNPSYTLYYLTSALITLLYYLKPFKLRQLGWYKPVHISGVFVFSCLIIPFHNKLPLNFIIYTLSQFALIFCLSVMFDFKDVEQDIKFNLRTYAVRFNLPHFKVFVSICLLLFIVLSFFIEKSFFYSSLITGLYLLSLLYFLNKKRDYTYYFLLLDGALILQFILTVCLS